MAVASAAATTRSLESQGGSALLLRLFESSFFNVHLALGYLKTYPSSIGITHYLVDRLHTLDADEVAFYWPELLHLVITRPTDSVALENFILERCEQHGQTAVVTLWQLQSSLSDLQLTPNTPQFNVCRRMFNRVQALIFTDPSLPDQREADSASSAAGTMSVPPPSLGDARALKMSAVPALLVGIGTVAGAPAAKGAFARFRRMLIDQGRSNDERRTIDAMRSAEDDDEAYISDSEDEEEEDYSRRPQRSRKAIAPPPPPQQSGFDRALSTFKKPRANKPSKPQQQRSSSSSGMAFMPGPRLEASKPPVSAADVSLSTRAHQSSPYLKTPSLVRSASNKIASPPRTPAAGGAVTPTTTTTPSRKQAPLRSEQSSRSVPSLPVTATSPSSSQHHTPAPSPLHGASISSVTAGLPQEFLSRVLRLHACRAQLDLLRSLQDISTRLVLVPKPARLSALRAELTVLNHGLPRGCALGMALAPEASVLNNNNNASTTNGSVKPKTPWAEDRVVRISPSEAMVLNSADRAPFVIHVELLEGDLDFDPARRQNAEDLRRAMRERERGAAAADEHQQQPTTPTSSRSPASRRLSVGAMDRTSSAERATLAITESDAADMPHVSNGAPTTAQAQADAFPPDEEMDLVEQMFGDASMHSAAIPAPDTVAEQEEQIHNRSIDEQAWARPSSGDSRSSGTSTPISAAKSRAAEATAATVQPRPGGRSIANARAPMSLDEYSERMRMAAIMLAQLDASQAQARSVTATGTAAAGALVGLPVSAVAGLGGVVGAGLGAVASRLQQRRADAQGDQASVGVSANLDMASAASGLSSVATTQEQTASSPQQQQQQQQGQNQPRQRVLGAAEATAIRERIMGEMMALEEERMERMREAGKSRSVWAASGSKYEDESVVMRAVNKDDPSGAVLSEQFSQKRSRIRAASPFGHLAAWNVISVIVKTGADLRQEQFAIQLVKEFGRIWSEEKCKHWIRYFRILVTSESSGLMETITDAVSVHSIKKKAYARSSADGAQTFASFTLKDHFLEAFGPEHTRAYRQAVTAFAQSLAAYSVVCYLLQIKDRHNGNILVDREGHVIHIDFGFMLSNSPGSLGFEMAPFKLTQEYIDLLGGFESEHFAEFKTTFKRLFIVARKHAERIIMLVELMQTNSTLPCFMSGEATSRNLRERFQLSLTQTQVDEFLEKLVVSAAMSTFTRLYDLFQYQSNGIL